MLLMEMDGERIIMVGEHYENVSGKKRYSSSLYEMALDGSKCYEMPMVVGAGWVIRQVRIDSQGAYWILYSYSTDDTKSAYQSDTIGSFLTKVSNEGTVYFTIDLKPYYNRSQFGYNMNEIIIDSQDYIYITGIDRHTKTSNYIWIFNSEGKYHKEIELQDQKEYYLSLAKARNGEIVLVNYYSAKQRTFQRILKSSWSVSESVNSSVIQIHPVFGGANSGHDIVEYGRDGVYGYNLDSGEAVELLAWKNTFVQEKHLSNTAIGNKDGIMVFSYYNYQKKEKQFLILRL
jgi:hypothetical protein